MNEPVTQEQVQALSDQVLALESQIQFLMNFGEIDMELTTYLLGFWLASFVGAHVAGRVARALGKF